MGNLFEFYHKRAEKSERFLIFFSSNRVTVMSNRAELFCLRGRLVSTVSARKFYPHD